MVRKIKAENIKKAVKDLCIKANTVLREDVLSALEESCNNTEKGTPQREMMDILLKNAEVAEDKKIALCQDTGITCVFIELGKDVVIDGDINEIVNKGVREAYEEGFFRKSVVGDPLKRNNTGDNTPAIIHIDITSGNKIKISVMPKGFGSENKNRVAMLNPTCSGDQVVNFCVDTVKSAGADACPPYVLGIGLGGTMEECALMAKKALLVPIKEANPDKDIAKLEEEIKRRANALNIGVMGLGSSETVIGVNIKAGPTHIAGLPVAVNISCHALRSASIEI